MSKVETEQITPSAEERTPFSLTRPSPWTRSLLVRNLPLRRLLPDKEPAYVSSLLYVMGVMTLAAMLVTIGSGVLLAVGGVQWWHTNSLGAFINSVHFWGVEAFFLFMAVHALSSFFTMAWRGGRGFTWVTGVMAFLLAVVTSFTGFLMMTNWDAQYVAQQAKDAFNSLGIGAVWNVMDAGQQFTLHVVVTAGILGFIVLVHLAQIRRRGVAPPPGFEHLEVEVASPTPGGPLNGSHNGLDHGLHNGFDGPSPAGSGDGGILEPIVVGGTPVVRPGAVADGGAS